MVSVLLYGILSCIRLFPVLLNSDWWETTNIKVLLSLAAKFR